MLLADLQAATPLAGRIGHSTLCPAFAALQQFEPQYLLADEGKIGFVLPRLNRRPGGAAACARGDHPPARRSSKSTQQKHPQAWIGLTGMPVIEHDEMAASQFDMLWTSIASMVLVLLLYLAAYGGLRHAMLVNGLLLLGTAYSFGFVTLAVGHLEHPERGVQRRADRPGDRFCHSLRRHVSELAAARLRRRDGAVADGRSKSGRAW